jgi:hypothetical protein
MGIAIRAKARLIRVVAFCFKRLIILLGKRRETARVQLA